MVAKEEDSCESRMVKYEIRMGDVSRASKAMRIVNFTQNSHVRKLRERLEKFPKFTD